MSAKRRTTCQPWCLLPKAHALQCSSLKPRLKVWGHRFRVSFTGTWECRKCRMSSNALHLGWPRHPCPGRIFDVGAQP